MQNAGNQIMARAAKTNGAATGGRKAGKGARRGAGGGAPGDAELSGQADHATLVAAPGAEAGAKAGAGDDAGPDAADPSLAAIVQKREFYARVAAASGAKKKDAKQIVDAALAVLGQALTDGEALNLPPLGKLRIVKARTVGGAEIVTLKLRRGPAAGGAAPEDEES